MSSNLMQFRKAIIQQKIYIFFSIYLCMFVSSFILGYNLFLFETKNKKKYKYKKKAKIFPKQNREKD